MTAAYRGSVLAATGIAAFWPRVSSAYRAFDGTDAAVVEASPVGVDTLEVRADLTWALAAGRR
jgi:hypothetical protein